MTFTVFTLGDQSASVRTGQELAQKTDGQKATVRDVWVGELGMVPALLLEMAGDPLCRTYSGLMTCLTIACGKPLRPVDRVTAIVLEQVTQRVVAAPASALRLLDSERKKT